MNQCPLCGRTLERIPNGLLRCGFHEIYFKGEDYPTLQAARRESQDELSEAQRNWLMDFCSTFTDIPSIQRKLYEIARAMFIDKDFWDVVHLLRRETGAHVHVILEAMRKSMERNPAAMKEVQKEGVTLPFLPGAASRKVSVQIGEDNQDGKRRKRHLAFPF